MNESEKSEGWTYEAFDRNTSPIDFGPFESLVALWRSKWMGDALPAWRDFEFEDFVDWYGWLIVEDIIPDGTGDVRFRLWGTRVTDLFQRDLTGKCMSEVGNNVFDPEEFEWVNKIADEGIILRGAGTFAWEGRNHKAALSLELPLADNGKTVTHILCGIREIMP